MSKKPWRNIFNPVTVLDNSPELKTTGFKNDRLLDLKNCKNIGILKLNDSKETIDLSALADITNLRSLRLDNVSYKNLAAVTNIETLHITRSHFSFSDINSMKNLKMLSFSEPKNFPDFTECRHLENIETLMIFNCDISDISFLENYPNLNELIISHCKVQDLDPLKKCKYLSELDLTDNCIENIAALGELSGLQKLNLERNPITDFSPLQRLSNLQSISADKEAVNQFAVQHGWIKLKPVPPPQSAETTIAINKMMSKIAYGDWDYIYGLSESDEMRSAIYQSIRRDSRVLNQWLAHPDDKALDLVVITALNARYNSADEILTSFLINNQHKLKKTLLKAFDQYNTSWNRHNWNYGSGYMNTSCLYYILSIMDVVASPDWSELYHRFLSDRFVFTERHLWQFKKMFDSIGKTKDHTLVEPLIDLLRHDHAILGGDNVYMKKCFKAIGQLGNASDIPLVEQNYSVANETREDVKKEYQAMLAKLTKKKRLS